MNEIANKTAGVDRSYNTLKEKVGSTPAEDAGFNDLQKTTWKLVNAHNNVKGNESPAWLQMKAYVDSQIRQVQNPFVAA